MKLQAIAALLAVATTTVNANCGGMTHCTKERPLCLSYTTTVKDVNDETYKAHLANDSELAPNYVKHYCMPNKEEAEYWEGLL